jgi:hypothetical protein
MTADSAAQTTREPIPGRSDRAELGLPAPTILSMCDGLLGEAGRRHHMFAWLRAPGAGAGEWLAVDAYYPRARLVVICRSGPGSHDSLYRELIPAHGLGLLMLDPVLLGNDREAVKAALAAKVFDLEHVPRERTPRAGKPASPSHARTATARTATARTATARTATARTTPARATPPPAPAPVTVEPGRDWTPLKVERTSVPKGLIQVLGILAGLAIAVVLIVEVYLGVITVAAGDGRVLLGLAIVLEAFSRALGTVAAERAGQRGWACGCAIGGAPIVAWFALLRPSGRVEVEPAPLAGRLALLAGVIAVVALLLSS